LGSPSWDSNTSVRAVFVTLVATRFMSNSNRLR